MMDSDGAVLYVGKAKNLKKRVSSYFRKSGISAKTRALVKRIEDIDITVTETETEALIAKLDDELVETPTIDDENFEITVALPLRF